jgi:hypothetical protein
MEYTLEDDEGDTGRQKTTVALEFERKETAAHEMS